MSEHRERVLNEIAYRHADEDWKEVELYILGGQLQPGTILALARIIMSQAILLAHLAKHYAEPQTPEQ